jgi:DNA polymerase
MACDYSNIEGRVNAWLAGEQWKVDAFRAFDRGDGPDLYLKTYAESFGVPIDRVDDAQRQVGKVQELALGFQGGVKAFQSMGAIYGVIVDDAEAERLRDLWRGAHPAIKQLWYDLDDAAKRTVASGELSTVAGGRIRFVMKGGCLWMILPSGRPLCYPEPSIRMKRTPWGEDRPAVRFMGVDSRTRRWCVQWLYGGLLCENAVQAIARDVMANAMQPLEQAGYPIILTVHDEVVCEVPRGFGSVNEMSETMCRLPAWAAGLPVAAAGWRGERYRKD